MEGLSAAGKGTIINHMIQPLDPRGFKVTCIVISQPGRTVASFSLALLEALLHPRIEWRFLTGVGTGVSDAQINGIISEADLKKAYADVRNFERQMRDGGTIILKFFL